MEYGYFTIANNAVEGFDSVLKNRKKSRRQDQFSVSALV